MAQEDRRLIEDFLPIREISAEATREKSVRQGHISTLHLWWERRPLVACRAAVYGALIPGVEKKEGRLRAHPSRSTGDEGRKARERRDSNWLYVVWDPTTPNHELQRVPDPAYRLEHAAKEVVATRFYDIPAQAIQQAVV